MVDNVKKLVGDNTTQRCNSPSKAHDISDSDDEKDNSAQLTAVRSPSFSKSVNDDNTRSSLKRASSPLSGTPKKLASASADEDLRPHCQYGTNCYRKNPAHLKEYRHPEKTSEDATGDAFSIPHQLPYNFFLTKVTGIDKIYNSLSTICMKDVLSEKMGNLEKSAQFSYEIDIAWLMGQYPECSRRKPLLIVHGCERGSLTDLQVAASPYDNIRLCQARLPVPYGTHHTKMMLLLYDNGMRIVIHTANLVKQDWHQKTQGVWLSPLFPKMTSETVTDGESLTHFKGDLIKYLSNYKARQIEDWMKVIQGHDMSSARVVIIDSVPGRHSDDNKHSYGHLKLRKVLDRDGPDPKLVKSWKVIGQFSSIGTLGPTKESWLSSEWLISLSTSRAPGVTQTTDPLLIFPTIDNVRVSLEGYPAGGSLPYSIEVAKKQPYLHTYFHQWKSESNGRSRASPHIKTYTRVSPDSTQIAWFLLTSANLSKAAWGALEKSSSQLMIRSYELGVLFLPKYFVSGDVFNVRKFGDNNVESFPLPYDLPLVPYNKTDRPWIWNIEYRDNPDSHGNIWCPPT